MMLNQMEIERLEADLASLGTLDHLAAAAEAWASRLDMLLPPGAITTNQWARNDRYVKGRNELPAKFDFNLTPYVEGIQDACDRPGVRVVAVSGNGRSGKTMGAENQALKRIQHGPFGDMFWYMQSKDAVEDYMEERGEWNLEHHEKIAAKIDHEWKRQSRTRKKIGESQYRWLAASKGTLRGKAAAFIVADEIDAYPARILKGLLTLLRNRQREFGSAALLYLCSHPDAGTTMGIDKIIQDGLRHSWYWSCLHCGKPSSPNPHAKQRMRWNLAELLGETDGVDRVDILRYVKEKSRLICPHCQAPYDNAERLILSRETGAWVQPGQVLIAPKKVDGIERVQDVMGFCIHAFMAPFISIGEAAEEYTAAKFDYDDTDDDENLKTATAFTLGEPYSAPDEDTKLEDWEVIARRMKGGGAYVMGTVPDGVHFLTAFVDVQVDRFVVAVIGWSQGRESWLIDRFEIKQWPAVDGRPAFGQISPFKNLADWTVLEQAVIAQSYPLVRDPSLHLPIARVGVDTGGGDETTNNARLWASAAIARKKDPIPEYRIQLLKGSSYWTGELYGKPRQVTADDRGAALPTPIWERTHVVNRIKVIIAKRTKIGTPGPGMMHAPQDTADKLFKELVSEKLTGDHWIKSGANEMWDQWVGAETLRASLQPERIIESTGLMIDFDRKPPSWARPFKYGVEPGIDTKVRKLVSPYSRMVEVNGGEDGANPYGAV
jgi:phage terminase large subunit GpA-like protein